MKLENNPICQTDIFLFKKYYNLFRKFSASSDYKFAILILKKKVKDYLFTEKAFK